MLDNTTITGFCHKEASSPDAALVLKGIGDEYTISVQRRFMQLTDRIIAPEDEPCFVLGYN